MLIIEEQRFVGLVEGLRAIKAANIVSQSLRHCRAWRGGILLKISDLRVRGL
jgi:hypothetical protein